MSIFQKFSPGLGHDGRGLYGTLTDNSIRRVLDRHDLQGKTHLDVGAADGKVMLGALSLGASRSFGIEISSACLSSKFEAMRIRLAERCSEIENASADLRCETDVLGLEGSVEDWMTDLFGYCKDEREIAVTAIWHGFNVQAKERVLAAIARSKNVETFSVVGPVRKEYGRSQEILDFFRNGTTKAELIFDDRVALAGGESYRCLTFRVVAPHSIPSNSI